MRVFIITFSIIYSFIMNTILIVIVIINCPVKPSCLSICLETRIGLMPTGPTAPNWASHLRGLSTLGCIHKQSLHVSQHRSHTSYGRPGLGTLFQRWVSRWNHCHCCQACGQNSTTGTTRPSRHKIIVCYSSKRYNLI